MVKSQQKISMRMRPALKNHGTPKQLPLKLFGNSTQMERSTLPNQCSKGKIDDDRLIIYATANIRATDITAFKDTITEFEDLPPQEQT